MSDLRRTAEEYLRLRRALGHKLAEAGRLLPGLVGYLEAHGLETVTVDAALAWAQQPSDADPAGAAWGSRMAVARGFAKHLAGIHPGTEVPPVGLLPRRRHRAVPYLYAASDVAALMAQARTLPSPFRAATYETLIGLLAATGMRVGEAVRLDRADVDWPSAVLTIRVSKFGKSRQLPLRASSVAALAAYATIRDRLCPRPQAPSFFVSTAGTRLIYANVGATFRALVARAGLTARSPARRPRIHDLRHSFAVATLLAWYQDGGDVGARLPLLSTYLGHRTPSATYWYLSAAPDLLALAAGRLEAAAGGARP